MTLTDFLLARIAEDEHGITIPNAHGGSFQYEPRRGRERDVFRKIVELHRTVEPEPCHCGKEHEIREPAMCQECAGSTHMDYSDGTAPCETLLTLATIYADHPDYRKEWRP